MPGPPGGACEKGSAAIRKCLLRLIHMGDLPAEIDLHCASGLNSHVKGGAMTISRQKSQSLLLGMGLAILFFFNIIQFIKLRFGTVHHGTGNTANLIIGC